MTSTSREKLGLALGFAGVLLLGGTLPATRLAVAALDPLLLSTARASIAGCCGLLLLFVLRRPWPTWTSVARSGVDRPVYDRRLSRLHGLGDGACAGLAWRRRTRHHSARHRRRGGVGDARAAEPRLLAGESRRRGHRLRLHGSPQRRPHDRARRSLSARHGGQRRLRLRAVRPPQPATARLGGDLLAGRDVLAVVACRHMGAVATVVRRSHRRRPGPRSPMSA